jgi:hypothetical protein
LAPPRLAVRYSPERRYVILSACKIPRRSPRDAEDAAEAQVLAAAIAEADADPRTVPHEEVRTWLLRIANGEFDAPPPKPR